MESCNVLILTFILAILRVLEDSSTLEFKLEVWMCNLIQDANLADKEASKTTPDTQFWKQPQQSSSSQIHLRALQKESPPPTASLETDSTLTGKQFPALLNRCSTEAQWGWFQRAGKHQQRNYQIIDIEWKKKFDRTENPKRGYNGNIRGEQHWPHGQQRSGARAQGL